MWTPITEALPEYMSSVLVYAPESDNIYCCYYYFYAGSHDPNKQPIWAFFDAGGDIVTVAEKLTHWAHLPDAPAS